MPSNDGKYYGAAAEYNRSSGLGIGGLLKIILLVLGGILVITAGYFIFSALTSGPRNDMARLLSRERNLAVFMANNQEQITTDELRTINSSAVSLINSDIYALQQGLKSNFGLSGVPESISKSETDTTSKKTLDTAKVQSRFDQVYVQLLRDKLASAQQLAQNVLGTVNDTTKTTVQTTIDHLNNIDTKLESLSL